MAARMDAVITQEASGFAALAPRPRTLADTGLGEELVVDLILKHLMNAGQMEVAQLTRELALPGAVVEPLVAFLRQEAHLEVRSALAGKVHYGLTNRGRAEALDAARRDGYVGPAPVPLAAYQTVVRNQSSSRGGVNAERMRECFSDVVLDPHVLDQFGPALHSGRAILIYGQPGSGKSFISRRLGRVLDDAILVPHAVQAGGITVRVFDPEYHRKVASPSEGPRIDFGHDPRYSICVRPTVSVGGEMTLDMLEIQYDSNMRQFRAPLQMRANNGLLVIDDLGRQKVPPEAILNRWIVPMEEGHDFLHSTGGAQFTIPFDVVLVFSTNFEPTDLADEAFLRRIGYKVRFGELAPDAYRAIWHQVCNHHGVPFDRETVDFAIEGLHRPQRTPLLACHPRDLIGLVLDRCRYEQTPPAVTRDSLRRAWHDYFLSAQ